MAAEADWVDWFVVDTAVRVSAPLALEVAVFRGVDAGLLEHAQKLRGLTPIMDRRSANVARPIATAVMAAAYAARIADVSGAAYHAAAAAQAAASANYFAVSGDTIAAYGSARAAAEASAVAYALGVVESQEHISIRRIPGAGDRRSAYFIRLLDLDVHSMAELEIALVAADYGLERGGGHDEKLRMETLQRFQPILAGIEANGFRAPSGLDNRFRRPGWSALPGAEAAYPGWSTFMAWPIETVHKWIDLLIDDITVARD